MDENKLKLRGLTKAAKAHRRCDTEVALRSLEAAEALSVRLLVGVMYDLRERGRERERCTVRN